MKIIGIYGKWYDRVLVDGKELSPADSLKVQNHSPDGFAWGYAGSGPAQLALAILLFAGLKSSEAQQLHQDFKREFIERQPERGDWTLELDVKAWALGRLAARESAAR